MKKYNAAIYVRLSREDGDKSVSNSIVNQKSLIKDFLTKHDDIKIIDSFEDDGFSGVSFDRPGFNRMMDQIMNGSINCVVVKDLSRLGRDYIETGKLLEQTFPLLSVRFISINDNIDTINKQDRNGLMVPFKNLMNEAYARDISKKTRSGLDARRKNGLYVSPQAPYGYIKDPNDKTKLIIDETASEIVKKIFKLKLSGYNQSQIARELNESNILSPGRYAKYAKTKNFKNKSQGWTSNAIRRILTNRIYTGTLVQGMYRTQNFKLKHKAKLDLSDCIVVENTHEAIVSKETFEQVQAMNKLDTRTSPKNKKLYVLSGFLVCSDCNASLIRKSITKNGKTHAYYVCATHKNTGGCTSHSISETKVIALIKDVLNSHIKDISKITIDIPKECLKQKHQKEIEALEHNKELLEKEKDKIVDAKTELYQDYKIKILSLEEYLRLKDEHTDKAFVLLNKIESLSNKIKDLSLHNTYEEAVNVYNNYNEISELTRSDIISFLKSIIVGKDKELNLNFKYQSIIDDFTLGGMTHG
ncbi:recombinase family protein [Mycoplasmatota bacterium zrk1]